MVADSGGVSRKPLLIVHHKGRDDSLGRDYTKVGEASDAPIGTSDRLSSTDDRHSRATEKRASPKPTAGSGPPPESEATQ